MSDIRFNTWLHRTGSGGVYQDSSGRVGIGSSVPTSALSVVGVVSATSFTGPLTGNVTGNVTGTLTGSISTTSITVGDSFIRSNQIGLGATTTTGRNAGIGTAEGTIIYNSTLREVQVYKGALGWTNIGAGFIEATGGTISDYESGGIVYRAHIFTSSGTFNVTAVPAGSTIETLVVAGGGGGGNGAPGSHYGGGGGAGGLLYTTGSPVIAGNYPITVGAGGAWGSANSTSGPNGTPSILNAPGTGISSITSQGGGGGAGPIASASGANGGSGGGACYPNGTGGTGNRITGTSTPAPTQGNNGASYPAPNAIGGSGCGGGGAGSAGGSPGLDYDGGTGLSYSISGITTTYARGGPGTPGDTTAYPLAGNSGVGNGGAGGSVASPNQGTGGGSGTVIIRYPIGSLTATAKATGGVISYYGGKTIHTFIATGTFVAPGTFSETIEYVVVAGGGGGGISPGLGAGGGAGGYRTGTTPISGPSTTSIKVGAGGAQGFSNPGSNPAWAGASGTPSFFGSPITSNGGGGGAGANPGPGVSGAGIPGGSGGGGAWPGGSGGFGLNPSTPAPVLSPFGLPSPYSITQGYPGGNVSASFAAGGGGGAGGAGGNGSGGTTGGNGGVGVQVPTTFRDPKVSPGPGTGPTVGGGLGTPGPAGSYYLAGGGGGSAPTTSGTGGAGGGAAGGYPTALSNALTNTGGGGGGGSSGGAASAGGSGIVIIAYPS